MKKYRILTSLLMSVLLINFYVFVPRAEAAAPTCDDLSGMCNAVGCTGAQELCASYECEEDCYLIWSCTETETCYGDQGQ